MSFNKVLGLILLLSFVSACSSTESENVKTQGVYAAYEVKESGGRIQAKATFYVGDGKSSKNGTVLQLTGGDSVECNGEPLAYNKDLFGKIQYQKTLPLQNSYVFTFKRKSQDNPDEVYHSRVELPLPMEIKNPKYWDSYRRGTPINVRWKRVRSIDKVSVSISGSGRSINGGGETTFLYVDSGLTDDGEHVLSGRNTNPDNIRGKVENVEIRVQRFRMGEMDDGLDGEIMSSSEDLVGNITLTR